ncbi:hypothetical protein CesoFtcFv8_015676 [Champsocephalus esox]|uniref:Uncharacterized protein n=1 Tax=Champsocephalus esox TaxID=159716 RepID=A0AAN8BT55_9TELE|nr:hypothetical protein CesoFtcFv8_015676 [Champsocephalus esox]
MATEEFYEVERLVDRRRSKKGGLEYLVSSTISKETGPYCGPPATAAPPPGPADPFPSAGPTNPPPQQVGVWSQGLSPGLSAAWICPGSRSWSLRAPCPAGPPQDSPSEAALSLGGPEDQLGPPSEAALSLGGPEDQLGPPSEAALSLGGPEVKPAGVQLGPGEERARMGTRPRGQNPAPSGAPPSSGDPPLVVQTAVTGATGSLGRRRLDEGPGFDKRLRFSVRQTESAYRYRDLVVRKQDGFTHILLSCRGSQDNRLTPEVMKEIQSAMATAASDDSQLVLLGAVGNVFCCGLDFLYFIRRLTDDRKKESIKMAETIRTFVNTFIQFRKPIIAAVNGPALGLGAAILPLCDVVWANEKAWFQTPYAAYGQTPDACSSFTFPPHHGPRRGQRAAAERQEANGPGGVF